MESGGGPTKSVSQQQGMIEGGPTGQMNPTVWHDGSNSKGQRRRQLEIRIPNNFNTGTGEVL
jgi:hypothetical protein